MRDQVDGSFLQAIEPHRGALRLHCYRMLGSSHDGDDIVQETMLRAWRARESLEDPAMLRPWLYRIATNACLDELKRRPKRAYPADAGPATPHPGGPPAPGIEEPVWLEPMPDTWLASAGEGDPSSRYTIKESVALAFVAALSILSPVQRATLLLRDVVGLSAEEAAQALGLSLSAANSALFRARQTVAEKLGGRDPADVAPSAVDVDEALLARYVRAFEGGDVDAFVALFHDDMRTTMPPSPTWIAGRAANDAFFRYMFASGRCGGSRVLRTSANGQPAFAVYRRSGPGAPLALRGIQVLTVLGGKVLSIDYFMTREAFPLFGLPGELSTG